MASQTTAEPPMETTMKFQIRRLCSNAAFSVATTISLFAAQAAYAQVDPVILSFATVGDSRQDPATAGLSGQDATWLQNTKAWSRIMREIQAKKSNMLFFNGDMIMGYGKADVPADTSTVSAIVGSQLVKMYKQYAFWRGMTAPMMETGTYIFPVPGNHEVQCNSAVDATCVAGKTAYEVNENAWRANMGDLIVDTERFKTLFGAYPDYYFANNYPAIGGGASDANGAGGTDFINTDQSQLSYSFDFRGNHFAVINTDPVGNDSHAPVNWLANDLQAAQGRGATHFFVFGHKPAYTYFYNDATGTPAKDVPITKLGGLDVNPVNQNKLWDLMEQYGATYFTGHEHVFNAQQPRLASGGTAWQVLVGSGGSPFDAAVVDAKNPWTDRAYAYANVRIFQSGKVQIDAYGFSDTFGPTQVIKSIVLAH
jgi:hypothetical protein